jgi:argininosuccinate lyase
MRLQQAYSRINDSPLAAGLATSGFPIDRGRLAMLLGFDGIVENSYDANHLSLVDSSLEVASALEISAIHLGQFAQDLHAQYAAPVPWLLLGKGRLTGTSSIMPQKRKPAALEQLQAQSSIMAGEMHTVFCLPITIGRGCLITVAITLLLARGRCRYSDSSGKS